MSEAETAGMNGVWTCLCNERAHDDWLPPVLDKLAKAGGTRVSRDDYLDLPHLKGGRRPAALGRSEVEASAGVFCVSPVPAVEGWSKLHIAGPLRFSSPFFVAAHEARVALERRYREITEFACVLCREPASAEWLFANPALKDAAEAFIETARGMGLTPAEAARSVELWQKGVGSWDLVVGDAAGRSGQAAGFAALAKRHRKLRIMSHLVDGAADEGSPH